MQIEDHPRAEKLLLLGDRRKLNLPNHKVTVTFPTSCMLVQIAKNAIDNAVQR
ncbi:hypothetical protein [Acidithrix ferrooxidans]|uniref:Uncharacterized protein n=1 Tax=Acidithrix ferrooxidans TaxID=1280514 RepID=A0A0D8HI40_9ACTN|nr:hypothetical protein [Acidithrix ferrooxidans]KJF17422.1 hypothetical protein AXFE_17000 [Acidithrix ferrooxidans]